MPDDELLDLAPAVGLDAVDDAELDDLQRRLDAESAEVREAFGRQVAATREAMASISHVTATAPPETLRDRVLAAARTEAERGASTTDRAEPTATVIPLHRRRRLMYAAAAAVVAVAVGAIGWVIGVATTSEGTSPQTAEQVFAATDVRTSSRSKKK